MDDNNIDISIIDVLFSMKKTKNELATLFYEEIRAFLVTVLWPRNRFLNEKGIKN